MWSVRSAREGVGAFAAYPDANAFAFNTDKPALGASVWLFEFSYDFDVAFSYSGTVSRTEPSSWTNFFCLGQLFSPV